MATRIVGFGPAGSYELISCPRWSMTQHFPDTFQAVDGADTDEACESRDQSEHIWNVIMQISS